MPILPVDIGDYDADDDFAKSLELGYAIIRARVAAGKPGWEPKMSDIARTEQGEIEQFDPERYRFKVGALNYGIEEAKRIKDWPALEKAVDLKIEEQRRFVAWWGVDIRRAGKPKGDKS